MQLPVVKVSAQEMKTAIISQEHRTAATTAENSHQSSNNRPPTCKNQQIFIGCSCYFPALLNNLLFKMGVI